MICIVTALALMCFDGVNPREGEKCNEPKELGFIICTDYPNCSIEGPVGLAYASESWLKENKVKWCSEVEKEKK